MESILHIVSEEPFDYTYLGIGSAPHSTNLDAKHDQLVPCCLNEKIVHPQKTFRILHFDPCFDRCESLLNDYFQALGLFQVEFPGGYRWVKDYIDVIVIPSSLEKVDHKWFFESLTSFILNTKGMLLVQEYTGYELSEFYNMLYTESSSKEKFKRRILFDMTYGTDIGCCTDMTVAQPFYDYDGNFLNLTMMTETEIKRWVGVSLKLDTLLRKIYSSRFLHDLNRIHVDYRRRLKGEGSLYGSLDYADSATPDTIMEVLQKKLQGSFDILLATNLVGKDQEVSLMKLFESYKNEDPYKWYDKVNKLIPRAF